MADYIKREDAITLINFENPAWEDYSAASHEYALECVRSCEAQDVVPVRHGRWVYVADHGQPRYKCSICGGNHFDLSLGLDSIYCGRCGAKMDGGEDDGN